MTEGDGVDQRCDSRDQTLTHGILSELRKNLQTRERGVRGYTKFLIQTTEIMKLPLSESGKTIGGAGT